MELHRITHTQSRNIGVKLNMFTIPFFIIGGLLSAIRHSCQLSDTPMRSFFAGPVINGELNPAALTFGQAGYRIQSQKLHIPDRFGWFAPGPPRLQVYDALDFVYTVLGLSVVWCVDGWLSFFAHGGGTLSAFKRFFHVYNLACMALEISVV